MNETERPFEIICSKCKVNEKKNCSLDLTGDKEKDKKDKNDFLKKHLEHGNVFTRRKPIIVNNKN